jgi:hypothetical protein
MNISGAQVPEESQKSTWIKNAVKIKVLGNGK